MEEASTDGPYQYDALLVSMDIITREGTMQIQSLHLFLLQSLEFLYLFLHLNHHIFT